ncbi:MAG TPA: hypothetical protein VF771_15610 [Longimicrobiaceae bacterium]
MAGSDHSGEDMEAGRVNRAENRTMIWAQREDDSDFDGDAILVVEAAVDIEDDDYKLVNDGLVAHGIVSSGIGAGAGVVGFSRRNPVFAPGVELSPVDLSNAANVGVFGKGTTGVAAQGDFRGAPDQTIASGRGVGIIGRGDKNLVSAPGVVGFSGGVTGETISIDTGVFGQGETGVGGLGTRGPGVQGIGSPLEPGVIGVGGKQEDPPVGGTGVVGLGGGEVLGGFFEAPPDTGVFGGGEDGVRGKGVSGRGGIFESSRSAQVQLVPVPGRVLPERTSFIPTVVADPGRLGPRLPKRGRAGDLMSVVDEQGDCTLWFCARGEADGVPARWAQVLLGPLFDGRA